MFRESLLLTGIILGLLAFLLAVGVRLLHGEEGRAEVLVVQGAQVLELSCEL